MIAKRGVWDSEWQKDIEDWDAEDYETISEWGRHTSDGERIEWEPGRLTGYGRTT